jgi:hypothetical protein
LPRFELAYEAEVIGFGAEGELISTGDELFVILFGETYRASPDQVARAREAYADLGEIGALLRHPRYAGIEEAGGVDAVRIDGELDLNAAGIAAGPADAEVWVGLEDRTVERVRLTGPLTVDAEISDVGPDAEIEPPPGGGYQPLDELIDRLQGFAGLAG